MRVSVVLLLALGLSGCLNPSSTVADFCAPPVGDSPVRGPADAWVTLVEFADFECPYCGRVTQSLTALETAYAADLRLVYKHFPLSFHKHAMDAAVAAECAHAQGRFWEMYDLLYDHQDALDVDGLETDASQAGVDVDVWRACLTTSEPQRRIEVDQELGLRAGISGTPMFFVNGAVIEGAVPLADFERVIDEELERAQTSGVAQESYYAGLERNACR